MKPVSITNLLNEYNAKLIHQDSFRWTIEIEDYTKMLRLEAQLQDLTGRPIDLRLAAKADKNKRFDRNYLRGIEKLEGINGDGSSKRPN